METINEVPVLKNENTPTGEKPTAIFIESAQEFCERHGTDRVLEALGAAYRKFKFTEGQFMRFKRSMLIKVPEIEKALKLIDYLKTTGTEPIQTKFNITDGLMGEAVCEEKNVVYLWLGANTVMEYNYQEATELLQKSLDEANKNLETFTTDLEYIKDQITIMEVNFARVNNYKVSLNQTAQAK